MYLLAHEEIQQSALQLITETELSDYRTQLYQWADAYQQKGWPESTPEYLLRGYTQLLREAGDATRLAALACDNARHERLWQVTGADLEALTEISMCFDHILTAGTEIGEQETATAVSLAISRDKLRDRMEHLPSNLVGLWAKLGNVDRAINLARSQEQSYRGIGSLIAVAEALSASHGVKQALSLANSINDSGDHDTCLGKIAVVLARTDSSEALSIASTILNAEKRAKAYTAIAHELAQAGRQSEAEDTVDQSLGVINAVGDLFRRAGLLATVAKVFSSIGNQDRAVDVAEAAVSIAEAVNPVYRRAQALGIVAQKVAAPDFNTAVDISRKAAKLLLVLNADEEKLWAARIVAPALSVTGLHDQAIELPYLLASDEFDRAEMFSEIGIALAQAGNPERALGLARSIEFPSQQAKVLIAAAEALVKAGQQSRAVHVAHRVLKVAVRTELDWQIEIMASAAEVLKMAGHDDQATSIASEATELARNRLSPRNRVKRLTEMVVALDRVGLGDRSLALAQRAKEVAETETRIYGRVLALATVAKAFAGVGLDEEARALFSHLIDTARVRIHPSERPESLSNIAIALADVGNHREASDLANEILENSRSASSPYREDWGKDAAARAFIAAGAHEEAMAVVHELPESMIPELLSSITGSLIAAGKLEHAFEAAEEIENQRERDRAIGYLAGALAARGDMDASLNLMEDISQQVMKDRAIPQIVAGLAKSGNIEDALRLTDEIVSEQYQSTAIGAISASCGPTPQGRLLLVKALSLGHWSSLIWQICSVAPEVISATADHLSEDGLEDVSSKR
ncbi:hypothetical protein [Streptomyces brasiliensis]|uniref:Uncharacterized protein n=1 Tax=Streptomyces brasiliensis TaxID=1954 RepID=A0A917NXC8_9ACTN|nr:hypothetical protein [Streptomyces brasiliensis]GGJ37574.1 hypothetical protein GCM10010121_055960 [Streptomyces brasiliensis]